MQITFNLKEKINKKFRKPLVVIFKVFDGLTPMNLMFDLFKVGNRLPLLELNIRLDYDNDECLIYYRFNFFVPPKIKSKYFHCYRNFDDKFKKIEYVDPVCPKGKYVRTLTLEEEKRIFSVLMEFTNKDYRA